MEQTGVLVPPPKSTIPSILTHLRASQRPPDLDFRAAENQVGSVEYDRKARGLFGNSTELLTRFGLQKDVAKTVSDTLQRGEWLFDAGATVIFHEAKAVSPERKQSGKEPFGFEEVPTAEIQFKLSAMIEAATKSVQLDRDVATKIMAGYAKLTRYKDFGLSLQFPVPENADGHISDIADIRDKIGECFRNAQSNALIMGGWTSSINFARREDAQPNGPESEADLSQQYLARKQSEGKSAFVVACAGPGMENNEFSDKVTLHNPFGPHDHMVGAAAAYTLLGRTNDPSQERELVLQGHSMSGAGMTAVLEHFSLPKNYNVSISILHPAIAGTNAWANIAEQSDSSRAPLLQKLGMKGLAPLVAGGIDVIDTTAEALHFTPIVEPVKGAISGLATRKLFLAGDERNMSPLVDSHVHNFADYTANSTRTALGSVSDLPLDQDILSTAMDDPDNPAKFVFVADKDDQMVKTANILNQLPRNIPLFVLDDHDEGSHYAFKRNCRSLRLSLLQQSMEQMTKEQFTFFFRDLFRQVYRAKPQSAQDIAALMEKQSAVMAPLFDVTPEDMQAYLQKRSHANSLLSRRAPTEDRRAILDALSALGYGNTDIDEHYRSVSGQDDLGLSYFYSNRPGTLAAAIMPEGKGNPSLAKIELMMETLEQLYDQVHFNEAADPLLNR